MDILFIYELLTGKAIVLVSYYYDWAAEKEYLAANFYGALVKQVVGGFKKGPKEKTDGFLGHGEFIVDRKLQLPEIVKMLGSLSSTHGTFFYLDALDECAALDRDKVLLSLKGIIEMSPATRVFLTGRPCVGGEVREYFSEGAAVVSISP